MANQKNPHYPGFYTVRETALMLGCDDKTVRNLIARGKIRQLVALRPARLAIADVHKLLKMPKAIRAHRRVHRKGRP